MTAVIDASALVAYCLKEKGLDEEIVKEYLRSGVLSVDLIKAESANAILVAKRRKLIDDKTARSALASVLELCKNNIHLLPEDDELVSEAFEMAESNNAAIYDTLYLLVAKKTKSALLSKDRNQIDLAKMLGVRTEAI